MGRRSLLLIPLFLYSYIKGDFIPIQILLTQELTNEQNLWLHNLNSNIQDSNVITTLLNTYDEHHSEKNYQSVMNIISEANEAKFKEATNMCEALERIYWEVHGERIMREQKEALDKAVEEAVAEAVAERDTYYQKQIEELQTQLAIATA